MKRNTSEPRSTQRLYRNVADKMLTMLDGSDYPPGTRLPSERELSEKFGVSRPTIREAIIALELSGRVEVRTGSGVYVLQHETLLKAADSISPFELTEARVLIEGEAAALAATMITAEQLHELEVALSEMEQENSSDKSLQSGDADRKFHTVISDATNNSALIYTIQNLWDLQQASPDIHSAHESLCMTDKKQRLDEHHAIYQALSEGNPKMARIAMRNHFSRPLEALHKASEAKAVEEINRTVSERRKRFSLNRFNENIGE
ncbi:MAG: GntR family transcriptional regulator [Alteromonadaceae bacterium]|nr:MAG: GntR family transcriptional regulator [Alteromonadaceae bacterium]